jgi:hypothetical protein
MFTGSTSNKMGRDTEGNSADGKELKFLNLEELDALGKEVLPAMVRAH